MDSPPGTPLPPPGGIEGKAQKEDKRRQNNTRGQAGTIECPPGRLGDQRLLIGLRGRERHPAFSPNSSVMADTPQHRRRADSVSDEVEKCQQDQFGALSTISRCA